MNKKFLIITLFFIVFLFCSVSIYANTDGNLGNEIQESVNKSESTLQSAGEGIKNIASDIGNSLQDATTAITQEFNGKQQSPTETTNNNENRTANSDYTATRTATDKLTGTTMSDTAWIWLILGIVGAIIIALTWYYVSQYNDKLKS